MKIRKAITSDKEAIIGVYLDAFPDTENDLEANIAVDLLSDEIATSVVSLVAENDNGIVAHIAFSQVTNLKDASLVAYILAPLAVRTEYQKEGIGSQLIQQGLEHLSSKGIDTVLVYGDPNYYGRFVFSENLAKGFLPPYGLKFPHGWLGLTFNQANDQKWPIQITCVEVLNNPVLW